VKTRSNITKVNFENRLFKINFFNTRPISVKLVSDIRPLCHHVIVACVGRSAVSELKCHLRMWATMR